MPERHPAVRSGRSAGSPCALRVSVERRTPARTLLIAVIVSQALAGCASHRNQAPEPDPAEARCEKTEVKIEFLSAGEETKRDSVEHAAQRLEAILASQEFGRSCRASSMNRTGGRSVEEVCWSVSCAGPQVIRVALFRDERMTTLAFEKKGAVFINVAKARAGTPGNLAHEFAHVLGYSHQSFWGISRKDAVPYVIGRRVREADDGRVQGCAGRDAGESSCGGVPASPNDLER